MELKGKVISIDMRTAYWGSNQSEVLKVTIDFGDPYTSLSLQRPLVERDLWVIGMPVSITITRGEPNA